MILYNPFIVVLSLVYIRYSFPLCFSHRNLGILSVFFLFSIVPGRDFLYDQRQSPCSFEDSLLRNYYLPCVSAFRLEGFFDINTTLFHPPHSTSSFISWNVFSAKELHTGINNRSTRVKHWLSLTYGLYASTSPSYNPPVSSIISGKFEPNTYTI